MTLRLYELDPGPLPLGSPHCIACTASTTGGLEWPALAAGEQRTLTAQLPVTGAAATVFFVSLYADSLATVLTNEKAAGIVSGLQDWKVALSIST